MCKLGTYPNLHIFGALLLAIMAAAAPVCVSSAWADTPAADSDTRAAEDSAYSEDASFGVNGFLRNNKGTARPVDDQDLGYRYPLDGNATLVVVNAPDTVIVYVNPKACAKAGFDTDSDTSRAALRSMIEELDSSHSMSGEVLADADKPWTFTTSLTFDHAGFTYAFNVKVGSDRYTSVKLTDPAAAAGATQHKDGTLWSDSAMLVPRSEVVTEAVPTVWERLSTFLTGIDYRPLWVSIKTSAVALAVTFVLGLLAAWRTMGTSSRLKGVLDSVFTVPMVLPPTVCGFLLLLLFGQSTALGRWFIEHGLALVFTWPAAVIAAIVVSFPLMYRTALGAFEGLDPQMLDAARTLGWSEARIFWHLMMPLGWPSIAAGTVLAFARAMGEFGCTLFFAGNYVGVTQTIPIAIYFEWMGGNTPVAIFWVIVVILFSFLVILFINIYTAHSQKYRSRGFTRAERRQLKASAQSDAMRSANLTKPRGFWEESGEKSEVSSDLQSEEPAVHDPLDVGGDALRIDLDELRRLMAGKRDQ